MSTGLLACSGHQNATRISLLLELRLALSLARATEILATLEVDLSHLGSQACLAVQERHEEAGLCQLWAHVPVWGGVGLSVLAHSADQADPPASAS